MLNKTAQYCHFGRFGRSTFLLFAFLTGVLSARDGRAQPKAVELHVAAAADMQPVFDVIGPIFEKRTGIKLRLSFGSSATLSEQMISGAPQDIFFSADYLYAQRVVASNLADSKSPIPYAKGKLVLWTRKGSPYDPLHLESLEDKGLQSVALANPDHAPYGRAAVAALKKMNFYANVAPHIVIAESVAQAAQFAQSGNAQLGVISLTVAMSPKFATTGSYVLFPTYVYPNIRQCAVIMQGAPQKAAAHKLLEFILSDEIQAGLPKLGLDRVQ